MDILKKLAKIAELKPEGNFYKFNSVAILEQLKVISTSAEMRRGSGLYWNIDDGFWQIIVALHLLRDKASRHQKTGKARAAVLGISGTQLIVLSAISLSSFGGPAFAVATMVDFAIAFHDAVRAFKRRDLMGWLDDSFKTLRYLEKRLAGNLNEEKRNVLIKEKSQLIEDINLRVRVHNSERNRTAGAAPVDPKIQNLFDQAMQFSSAINQSAIKLGDYSKGDAIISDSATNAKIQKEVESDFQKSLQHAGFKGLAFVGMTLLAIPTPPTQAAGFVIVSFVSLYYFAKHVDKLQSTVRNKGPQFVKEKIPSFFKKVKTKLSKDQGQGSQPDDLQSDPSPKSK